MLPVLSPFRLWSVKAWRTEQCARGWPWWKLGECRWSDPLNGGTFSAPEISIIALTPGRWRWTASHEVGHWLLAVEYAKWATGYFPHRLGLLTQQIPGACIGMTLAQLQESYDAWNWHGALFWRTIRRTVCG